MKSTVCLRVWGDYACFTRPEMKVERVSYDCMTPSAARGILEAIHWKPQITWVIDRIHVLKPIRFTSVRRNEVAHKIPAGSVSSVMNAGKGDLYIVVDDGKNRQQRAATILRDVDYLIEAHFDLRDDSEPSEKHAAMFKRRAENGQCFHHPYFGCREFPAYFALHTGPPPVSPLQGTRELGYMLHDIDFDNDMQPRFFPAKLVDGVLDVPPFGSGEVKS